MSVLHLTGYVDDQHRLSAVVPESIPPGPVSLSIVSPAQEDEAGDAWMAGVAKQWADDLGDPRQDIYTLDDGAPIRAI